MNMMSNDDESFENGEANSLWIVSVLASMFASICTVFGQILQKRTQLWAQAVENRKAARAGQCGLDAELAQAENLSDGEILAKKGRGGRQEGGGVGGGEYLYLRSSDRIAKYGMEGVNGKKNRRMMMVGFDHVTGDEHINRYGSVIITPMWLCGFFLMAVPPLFCNIIAYMWAPQSLIAPLSGFTILLNMMCVPYFLNEELQLPFPDLIATLLILLGCVLTTLGGNHESQNLSISSLFRLAVKPLFLGISLIYFVIILVVIIILTVKSKEHDNLTKYTQNAPPILVVLMPAIIAGIAGAFANVSLKALAEMIKMFIVVVSSPPKKQEEKGVISSPPKQDDDNEWSEIIDSFNPVSFIIIIIVIVSILLAAASVEINFLNRGMALFPSSVFIPIYTSIFILCNGFYGAIFYEEYLIYFNGDGQGTHFFLFLIGLCLVILAILLFSFRKIKPSPPRQ